VTASTRRRLALAAVVAAALSFGYGAGWPDVSRLGLTESVALHGTLHIDRYASQTKDRADFAGHAYTAQAPGNSFLAVPSFEAMRVFGLVDGPARTEGVWHDRLLLWLLRASTGGLSFCALLALIRASADDAPVLGFLAACTTGLATMALPLAATTFSHLGAGALAFGAFLLVRSSASRGADLAAGMCAGAAVVFEYTAILLLLIVGAYTLVRRRDVVSALRFSAGAVVPFALLAAYDTLAFGSPRHLSYRYVSEATFPGQHRGFFGVSSPSAHALTETLAGHRGLFLISPVLLVALAGLLALWRRGRRADAVVAGAAAVALIVLSASYFDPYGGLSPGPRYAAAALPFLALGLPDAYRRLPRTTSALAVVSLCGALYEAGTYGPNFDWATVWWWLGVPRLIGMAIVVALAASAVVLAAPDVISLVRAKRRLPVAPSREVAA
jgi:hypothetical protein